MTEICHKAGLFAIDVSQLFGVVRGFTVGDVADARASLQPLMLRYAFDAVERDGTLVFRMRDGRYAIALQADQLALSNDLDGTVEQTRSAEAELAGRVRLRFVQADAAFDVLSEEAVLPDQQTHSVSNSEIPIALTRVEGRQVAERWLTEARVARETVRFALPPSRLSLGAGDVVSLSADQLGVRRALSYRSGRAGCVATGGSGAHRARGLCSVRSERRGQQPQGFRSSGARGAPVSGSAAYYRRRSTSCALSRRLGTALARLRGGLSIAVGQRFPFARPGVFAVDYGNDSNTLAAGPGRQIRSGRTVGG